MIGGCGEKIAAPGCGIVAIPQFCFDELIDHYGALNH